jgi:hypothetical protein
MVNALFPPGTPVSTAGFLGGVTRLLNAGRASLVLVQHDMARDTLPVLDAVIYNADTDLEARFENDIHNRTAWNGDPISARIRRRLARRPSIAFTYGARNWLKRMSDVPAFSRDVLDSMDASHDLASLIPFGDKHYCLLSVYRRSTDARPFTPMDRRMLSMIHDAMRDRLVELRASRIRSQMPEALRSTFGLILAGHSEKEVAKLTHRSPNTVHDHVKRIYQHFEVSSRAQLLSRFVDLNRLKDQPL